MDLILGVAELTSLLPGRIAMNPLTALGFILAGASLWLRQEGSAEPGRRTRVSSMAQVGSSTSSTESPSGALGPPCGSSTINRSSCHTRTVCPGRMRSSTVNATRLGSGGSW